MEVREEDAVTAKCDGIVYYFCSEGCRDKFLRERTCARTAYDLIIVGGGPSGLTAAVYACILKVEALLVTKDLDGSAWRCYPSCWRAVPLRSLAWKDAAGARGFVVKIRQLRQSRCLQRLHLNMG